MKAIKVLYEYKNLRVLQGSDKKDYILKEIDEAMEELEALQQVESCESCKHWKVRNKLVRSNECFKWSGSVMTPRDFCCNRYEPKDNE